MGMRRQILPYLFATTLLVAPVAAMGAHASDSTTVVLAALTYGTAPATHGYSVGDAHDDIDIGQPANADMWDVLELAVPELTEGLELAVTEDDDGYELALPDFDDGLELVQSQSFGISADGLENR